MPDDDPDPAGPRRRALLALLAIVALLAGGLWLERRMHTDRVLEDCVLSGRRNCVAIPQ